jgi:Ala-tRNA(Pro) deacylase
MRPFGLTKPLAWNTILPQSPETLFAFLDQLGITTTTVAHPPLRTVEESQALRGEIPGAHTKNLFLKDKKGSFFLVTASEDARLDLKAIHTIIGAAGRVSFGNPHDLMALLGVAPGAVTPFGAINDTAHRVRVILDEILSESDTVNAHPLVNTETTSIRFLDLIRFLQATGHEPAILKVAA